MQTGVDLSSPFQGVDSADCSVLLPVFLFLAGSAFAPDEMYFAMTQYFPGLSRSG